MKHNLREISQIAKNFIINDLKGDAGTLEPMKTKYDTVNAIWEVKYDFHKESSKMWTSASLIINDDTGNVTGFDVEESDRK